MYRFVSNGLLAGQNLSNFWNSSTSGQNGLIQIMNNNKNANQRQNLFPAPSINSTTASIPNTSKGYYDPKAGTWVTSGNQLEAYKNLMDRQAYNQTITQALTAEGIKLTSKEKMTLTIDQDGRITVSGLYNEQKKTQIEEALNGTKDLGTGLLLHIEKIKTMNGKQNPLELEKWLVSGFLKNNTGQDISELKLVNGKITGANEKLQKIIDGSVNDYEKNSAYYQEAITDLKSVLAYGPDKIADLKPSIDYQNGSLVDLNVKYGFGTDQLKSWFGNVMSGKARWDSKA